LDEKPEGKVPLARPRHRYGTNIEIGLNAVEFEHVDCIHVVKDRVKLRLISAWY
jgi:hypothetical protein